MQGSGMRSTLSWMLEMRLSCEREIPTQQHRIDAMHTSYKSAFDVVQSEAQRTIQLQGKLDQVKSELKEAEDSLVKSLAVKARKEAKQMALEESISVMKDRVEELKRIMEDQKNRKEEYATILSEHSKAFTTCEEQCNQSRQHLEQIEEPILWYNKVLGFRIESGHGVKFIFTNITQENPDEEYSFTLRHANEIYTLLKCDPHLNDTKELVKELNKTNGLFKFVRSMRQKFLEVAAHGTSLHGSSINQDSSIISPSAPVALFSTDHTYESPLNKEAPQNAQSSSNSRKVRKGGKIFSPRSPTSVRRSARLKVTK